MAIELPGHSLLYLLICALAVEEEQLRTCMVCCKMSFGWNHTGPKQHSKLGGDGDSNVETEDWKTSTLL